MLPAPEGGWMMLLGAQREDGTGAILRWDSTDRRRWGFTGEVRFDRPELRAPGFMDECPSWWVCAMRRRGRSATC
ncbi:hypothetical protein A5N15_02525 [Rothia kristinae]|uniref:Glycosyl hydrolase family 32 N-terminal domain-containing protein n=1 Tax=Rothia kristinae TaxID=37923 RepID=A0A657IXD0_9MICC|nr:hypothetical protein A5N15_02525 [Rothia kristinae]